MNKLWILPTICFIIVLAWSVPSYYYQKAKNSGIANNCR